MKRHLVAGVLLLLTANCATELPDAGAPYGEDSKGRAPFGCSAPEQIAVNLDVRGPGTSTPEEAVAPFAHGPTTLVTEAQGSAMVHALGPDGAVTRIFTVKQRTDGWWPESYTECADWQQTANQRGTPISRF